MPATVDCIHMVCQHVYDCPQFHCTETVCNMHCAIIITHSHTINVAMYTFVGLQHAGHTLDWMAS